MNSEQERQQRKTTESSFTSSVSGSLTHIRNRLFSGRRLIFLALVALLIIGVISILFVTQIFHRQPSLTTTKKQSHTSLNSMTGKITEFALPPLGNQVPGAITGPSSITTGPAGNLWFVEPVANKIGRITSTGIIKEFPLPPITSTISSGPHVITNGPDGNIWFASQNKIERITPSGAISKFSIVGTPSQITAGPDGNFWFTLQSDNMIGRMSPSGFLTVFKLESHTLVGDGPLGITAGPDRNLWFTESGANRIGRITPTGAIKEFMVPFPDNTRPKDSGAGAITVGPDGNLWFTETDTTPSGTFINKIGRMTLNGIVTEFTLSTPIGYPSSEITAGLDGNLWFTESGANRIGRITPTGTITEFPVPTPHSGLGAITATHNAIWFTEAGANKIGRLTY